MAYLSINNVDIPIASGERIIDFTSIGGKREYASTGMASGIGKRELLAMQFQTTLLPADDAQFLAAMINGEGWRLSFDDSYYAFVAENKPTVFTSYNSAARTDTFYRSGGGSLYLPPTARLSRPNLLRPYSPWTIICWYSSGGGWLSYMENSDYETFINGAPAASQSFAYWASTSGSIGVSNTTASDYWIDELIIIPAKITEALAYDFHLAYSAGGYFTPPDLFVSGDALLSDTLTMRGEVTGMRIRPFSSADAWEAGGRILNFTLQEKG